MDASGGSTVHRVGRRSTPSLGQHKLLIAMVILALAYCVGAPYAATLIAHFGS
jgi:hypothetical protein